MYRVDFKSYRSCHTLLVSFLIISHFNISFCSTLHFFFGLVSFRFLFPCFICKKNVETCELTHLLSTSEFLYIWLEKMYPIILQVYVYRYFHETIHEFMNSPHKTREDSKKKPEICVWTFSVFFMLLYSWIHWLYILIKKIPIMLWNITLINQIFKESNLVNDTNNHQHIFKQSKLDTILWSTKI